ncbi:MAG: ABC transporter substrate-binding protein, partial [bacterium]
NKGAQMNMLRTKVLHIMIVSLIGSVLVSLIGSVLFIGCSKKTQKVSLGYVSTGLTGLAVQVMKDLKIPEKYGIEFEYQGFLDPSSSNDAFVLGKYQVNLAAGVNVIALARSKGYKVQYFFPTLVNSVSLLVKKDSLYNSLSDLKGRKTGWYGLPSGGGTAFYVLAKKKGIDILKDYQLIQSKPPALPPLLEKGELDAIVIYEPFVSRMLATGNYRVILGPFYQEWEKETGFKMEMSGFAAKDEWIDQNFDLIKKLIKAWKETVDYIKNHPKEVLEKYPDYTNLKTPQEIELGIKNIPLIYTDEWGTLDQSIQLMLNMLANDSVLITQIPEGTIKRIEE